MAPLGSPRTLACNPLGTVFGVGSELIECGKARLQRGELEGAREAFRDAVERSGNREVVRAGRYWLAETLLRLGKRDRVEHHLSLVVSEDRRGDTGPYAAHLLGWVLLERGDAARALGQFEPLVRGGPPPDLAPVRPAWTGPRPLRAQALRRGARPVDGPPQPEPAPGAGHRGELLARRYPRPARRPQGGGGAPSGLRGRRPELPDPAGTAQSRLVEPARRAASGGGEDLSRPAQRLSGHARSALGPVRVSCWLWSISATSTPLARRWGACRRSIPNGWSPCRLSSRSRGPRWRRAALRRARPRSRTSSVATSSPPPALTHCCSRRRALPAVGPVRGSAHPVRGRPRRRRPGRAPLVRRRAARRRWSSRAVTTPPRAAIADALLREQLPPEYRSAALVLAAESAYRLQQYDRAAAQYARLLADFPAHPSTGEIAFSLGWTELPAGAGRRRAVRRGASSRRSSPRTLWPRRPSCSRPRALLALEIRRRRLRCWIA